MTKGPKTTMKGTYKSTSYGTMELNATGQGSRVLIDQFYLFNGKQYALGSIVCGDGTIGNVTMVRP